MLKPFTLSLSLALALGACSVSMAGLFHGGSSGCSTCGLASPQSAVVAPSSQCAPTSACAPKKRCNLFSGLSNWCNKPKCYTYTWVLKKKRVRNCGSCGGGGCNTCSSPVYPTGQGYSSPQGYSAPTYGSYQTTYASPAPAAAIAAAPGEMTPVGDEAPPAPPAPVGPQSSLLFSSPAGN